MPIAHVGGLPLEEAVLAIAPVACVLAVAARAALANGARRLTAARRRRP